jgi:predicted small lipoprotein YifL
MKNLKPIIVNVSVILLIIGLAGCGQKGALVKPKTTQTTNTESNET